jgi:AcrR family transcriptional regulator
MTRKDRRVNRTIQLLRDALIDLCLERGYDSLTIQDITDRANLGRATFYLHFRDKDELLFSILRETADELYEQIDTKLNAMFRYGDVTPLQITFQHAAENRNLYQIILHRHGVGSVERELRDYVASKAEKHIEEVLHGSPSPFPIKLSSNIVAQALLGTLEWWLENDTPYPADYMARAFYELSVVGIFKAMGMKVASKNGGDAQPETQNAHE